MKQHILFPLFLLAFKLIEHRIKATEKTIQFVITNASIIKKKNHHSFRSLFSRITFAFYL